MQLYEHKSKCPTQIEINLQFHSSALPHPECGKTHLSNQRTTCLSIQTARSRLAKSELPTPKLLVHWPSFTYSVRARQLGDRCDTLRFSLFGNNCTSAGPVNAIQVRYPPLRFAPLKQPPSSDTVMVSACQKINVFSGYWKNVSSDVHGRHQCRFSPIAIQLAICFWRWLMFS
jgi:hypothetical protein